MNVTQIAEYRAKYFDKFVGYSIKNCDGNEEYMKAHPDGWYGMTPDEATRLADKIVTWLYSDMKH